MTTIRYTLDNPAIGAIGLGRWVHSKMRDQYDARDCLAVARALIRGECWEPDYLSVTEPEEPGPCRVEITHEVHPNVVWFNQQQEYRKLGERGAAGDADAAREFCQLVIDGEYLPGAAFAG